MKVRFAGAVVLLAAGFSVQADEGMWLFNQFPKDRIENKYGFQVTDVFLDHLRLGSVRFNNGGSGSFISPSGLLFTNHHVGADCIQKLSTAEHDYMAHGFYAATQAEEQGCPDLEVNVLLKVADVTPAVNQGTAGQPAAGANRVRMANTARIEKECAASTGQRCEVVTLYSGGQYHLYQYKKYTDIRLVFAPEYSVAAFGGDPDNFTYPRYCLDFALFRAYENGKPVKAAHYFKWSRDGVKNGELIFVPGNPGSTGRLSTVAELEFSRDFSFPFILARLKSLVGALLNFAAQSPENAREAAENLQNQQNSLKAYTGFQRGLEDPELMARKREEEQALRAKIASRPAWQQEYGKTWDEIAASYHELRSFYKPYWALESQAARGSELFRIARDVVRHAEETSKPNGERLRDYRDSRLPSLEQELYSDAPLYPALETAVLTSYFQFIEQQLGADDPTVKAVLAGRTPAEAAARYVSTSKLADVAERKRLANNLQAVKDSGDGMIRLALLIDGRARALRKEYEDKVEAVLHPAAARIAQARFAVNGAGDYPDATFTLRLTYGVVRGYQNSAGRWVPYATDFAGLYRRATGVAPFRLPERWLAAKKSLKLDTPFDFVSTADTHGGNSGSPTLNTKGEIVGILFDGNLEGLPSRFVYTEEQARSVHVASQSIIAALRGVYGASRILEELGM